MALNVQQLTLVETRLANEKKSTGTAYLLWLFLGSVGAHRFYLGSTGIGITQLILIWLGALLSVVMIGIPMVIVGLIWVLVDVFLIPGLVANDAANKRNRIMQEVSLNSIGA